MTTRHEPRTPGERIRQRRLEVPKYRRSQGALAADVGVTRTTVSAWETDKFTPEGGNLRRLAECLGVSGEWIVQGDPSRPAIREVSSVEYRAIPRPGASPAEQLMAFMSLHFGWRRAAGEMATKTMLAAAYTLAMEDRLDPEELAKLDRWRDQILEDERRDGRS